MKVVYNACYGGFGLSPLAQNEFAKRKGITLTWHKQEKNKYKRINGVPEEETYSIYAFTKDCGDEFDKWPKDLSYYNYYYEDLRSDSDLIEIVEKLKEKANGLGANLKITEIPEIPDGAEFEIAEYDGMEDVVPPRMSW